MNFREDKKVIIPILLVLAAFVGWKSWKDLNPPVIEKQQVVFDTRYFVRDEASLKAVPDNGGSIIIWAGDLGMEGLTPSPIAPVSIPQREVDPLYVMPEIPTDLPKVFPIIQENIESWRGQNNTFNAIFIDYTAAKPDLVMLEDFCSKLRTYLKKNYWLFIRLRRDAVESAPNRKIWLANMGKDVQAFAFDRKEERKPAESLEEMIKNLDSLGAPFVIVTDEIPDYASLTKTFKDARPKFFAAFMLDMTALRQSTQ
ncbi:MAG: hypothetical protein ACAH80_11740 [Alphaproteobacteria bacterium]